jgi:hypothetical protein
MLRGQQFFWPTPLPVSADTQWENIAQAAASGDPATGLFGNARNHGGKFHEGLDIRPAARNRRGEPTDTVRAVMRGTVAHLAPTPNGAYGRYVVLRHAEAGLSFYTLYAHLQSVAPELKTGAVVPAGATLGVMGRSDGARGFPKERAHLHFEVGVRLSPAFDKWYARQKDFTTPNRHGAWNGFNLNGTDPLPFLRAGLAKGTPPACAPLFRQEPAALTVQIVTTRTPDFVRENPALLTAPVPSAVAGWKIEFAWHGMPVRWTPLAVAPAPALTLTTDDALLRKARIRGLVTQQKNGKYATGHALRQILGILFEQ